MGTLVDLTQRKRWTSPPSEPLRQPPTKLDTDPQDIEALDSLMLRQEIMQRAAILKRRHGDKSLTDFLLELMVIV